LKRLILITGRPGIGKTTILTRVIDRLKSDGYNVGGFTSAELRVNGVRVGFKIKDLSTGESDILAHIDLRGGPSLGKYHVNLNSLSNIGSSSIVRALENADIIAVDEVGPMELFSNAFRTALKGAVDSKKPMLCTLHANARDPIIEYIKSREDSILFEVTLNNRERLHEKLVALLHSILKSKTATAPGV
jgi:nucleoside-triphosphatase